ncbi:alpha-glucuronidase family glycosyl hydrolase [Caulobacter sp. S45]|uniref:alpha-glucuronidase family glycosyl hydrolase n=1 Tax=Caulobacter sp. S45 TaxID=1641861 RepID=UPI00131ADB3B|nr:alpha-glucuronidase family glycosyl hydrolase [Caulobacter sp. S45]
MLKSVARTISVVGIGCALLTAASAAQAEDGYDLWLRYRPVETAWRARYRAEAAALVGATPSPQLAAVRTELQHGLDGLLAETVPATQSAPSEGAVVFGTPASSPLIAQLNLPLQPLGPEGYLIRSVVIQGRHVTVIAANSDIGVLYGAFRFLRQIQTRQPLDRLDIADAPKVKLRLLNHWDNLDRTIERGYAGASLWDWQKLPDYLDPRYTDYARADASIGINGTVLNNVNAKAESLTPLFLRRAAGLADAFRPYGVRVYLSARFTAPIEIGGLKTADPLDPQVKAWWRAKADEIYALIPDFGGFVVKANSEGEPGPQDYHRTHADGANALAQAVAPHHGVVMYRAFVYSQDVPDDRAKQAYAEFKPLDGQFDANVIVQVKNGAIDFQPREPFHPLFGAMPRTPLMMEFQITKEYLGFSTHLVYLAPLFEETLRSDTYAKGPGSTVAKVVDGELDGHALTGMAGVANTGTDRNWSGSIFDQANWYAFGRLAWDPTASSREIAQDWTRMTFSNDPAFVRPVVGMMMGSREAAVDYMTPLGLHHQMARSSHYGPGPWVAGGPRPDWTSVYFNKADDKGIGFDRTATGSDAVAQYTSQAVKAFDDPANQDRFLLWFHHVSWDARTTSGRTLWDEMVARYSRGVSETADMGATWAGLGAYVDPERFAQTATFLRIQEKEARWWRDACIAYFQTFSKRPLPTGYAAPEHPLAYYEGLQFPFAAGTAH